MHNFNLTIDPEEGEVLIEMPYNYILEIDL
jgi:hypothetical protein